MAGVSLAIARPGHLRSDEGASGPATGSEESHGSATETSGPATATTAATTTTGATPTTQDIALTSTPVLGNGGEPQSLASTGGRSTIPLGLALAALGFGGLALTRRVTTS